MRLLHRGRRRVSEGSGEASDRMPAPVRWVKPLFRNDLFAGAEDAPFWAMRATRSPAARGQAGLEFDRERSQDQPGSFEDI
jgi:hypothetical protein